LLRRNWIAKILSLSLAIGFWYVFVPGSKTIEVTYNVPVTVENLPPGFELEAIQPPEVTATFVGPRRAFYLFDDRKLRATADGSLADRGRRTFNLSEQNIRYPKDLTVREIRPNTVRISVKKSITRALISRKLFNSATIKTSHSLIWVAGLFRASATLAFMTSPQTN
jgi:hypothetical protein